VIMASAVLATVVPPGAKEAKGSASLPPNERNGI